MADLSIDFCFEFLHILAEQIQNSLRAGDVFTQYSGGQFLVMVLGASKEQVEPIAQRIHDAFYRVGKFDSTELLLHHSFPM